MTNPGLFLQVLQKHSYDFASVVPRADEDKIVALDLSKNNRAFTESIYNDADRFSAFINYSKRKTHATYLLGGYNEVREMYRRSDLFINLLEEPRSLHLGIDIWADAGTKISAPLGGMIHSFAFNKSFGDYGVTIILQHQLETINFYTLYGHLSLKDIEGKRVGQFITRGENFAHTGQWEENGNWPPHLHFQVILDMINYVGDYPGVCKLSEADKYLCNSPDPSFILKL